MERRHFLVGLGAVVLSGTAGCLGGNEAENTEGRVTVFFKGTDDYIDRYNERFDKVDEQLKNSEITEEEAGEKEREIKQEFQNNLIDMLTEEAESRDLRVEDTSRRQALVSGPITSLYDLLNVEVVTRLGSEDEFEQN